MKNFNIPPEPSNEDMMHPNEATIKNLAEQKEQSSAFDSITLQKAEDLRDSRTHEEIMSDMESRGKDLSEKALKSEEFKVLTAQKFGTPEEAKKAEEIFDRYVTKYEQDYKQPYQKQLDTETGVEDYANELHESL